MHSLFLKGIYSWLVITFSNHLFQVMAEFIVIPWRNFQFRRLLISSPYPYILLLLPTPSQPKPPSPSIAPNQCRCSLRSMISSERKYMMGARRCIQKERISSHSIHRHSPTVSCLEDSLPPSATPNPSNYSSYNRRG